MASDQDRQEKTRRDADRITECLAAIEPFSRISPNGERIASASPQDGPQEAKFSGVYCINRAGCKTQIPGEAIAAAAGLCAAGKPATLAECAKVLKPFAKLAEDARVEDPKSPILRFPGVDGTTVDITNPMIARVRELYESLSE